MNSRCDGALAALVGDGLPVVVHPALCGSHGNKTLQPQEVGRKGILGSRPVGSGSHSGVVYEEAREKSVRAHTHTHRHTRTSSLKFQIHQCYSPCCITVTPVCARFQRSLPPSLPGSRLGVLPRLNWYSQGPAGWQGPKLAGGSQGFMGCN